MEQSTNRHPADRRIDDRVPVNGIEMEWGLDRGRFPRGPALAHVLNVSRGGLLALVPYSRAVVPGAKVPVVFCGGRGTVEVTHVRSSARRRWRMCGLRLVDGDIALLDAVERILTDPTGDYARAWAAVG